ncbi:MAG: hypothetical protein OXG35_21705, partial [Acidobacteria bacterium]|nr:hypothetical protein [Acidobacteriota bacterium]
QRELRVRLLVSRSTPLAAKTPVATTEAAVQRQPPIWSISAHRETAVQQHEWQDDLPREGEGEQSEGGQLSESSREHPALPRLTGLQRSAYSGAA